MTDADYEAAVHAALRIPDTDGTARTGVLQLVDRGTERTVRRILAEHQIPEIVASLPTDLAALGGKLDELLRRIPEPPGA